MLRYRIYRIKDAPRESFRWAAHTGGMAVAKIKDYDRGLEIEAATPYDAWARLVAEKEPLHAGDLLEELSEEGSASKLHITKYIGFEPAQWQVVESKSVGEVTTPTQNESITGNYESHV